MSALNYLPIVIFASAIPCMPLSLPTKAISTGGLLLLSTLQKSCMAHSYPHTSKYHYNNYNTSSLALVWAVSLVYINVNYICVSWLSLLAGYGCNMVVVVIWLSLKAGCRCKLVVVLMLSRKAYKQGGVELCLATHEMIGIHRGQCPTIHKIIVLRSC